MDKQYYSPEDEKEIAEAYEKIIKAYLKHTHDPKLERIHKAFLFAKEAHKKVRRKSGEAYIMHPLAVALIVADEIGLGSTSICSALLHDVIEDTYHTKEEIEKQFTPSIASIVVGLTKISGGKYGQSAQTENFRKLFLTIPDDLRVIIIKMADRLHNMRTLGVMRKDKQYKIAGETKYIYAPIAQRLGFFAIKTELENLSFKYEDPEAYQKIVQEIESITPQLEANYQAFIKPIKEKLDQAPFAYEIKRRIKSPYSVHNKMLKKHIDFDQVYDLMAIRIIIDPQRLEDEKSDCWNTYSTLTTIYKSHPDRMRDWINQPKSNGYEAIHVTLMAPGGTWIEVQIRSKRMNEIAERGIAAHWAYKQGGEKEVDKLYTFINEVRAQVNDQDFSNPEDFFSHLKLFLYAREILIFTPKGDSRTLPSKSTVLDFAFSLHTDLGAHCIGAKVDQVPVPKNTVLKSGQQVEILTSPNYTPNIQDLESVVTSRAKSYLRNLFAAEIKSKIKIGSERVEKAVQSFTPLYNKSSRQLLLDHYGYNNPDELYYAVGNDKIDLSEISLLFKAKNTNPWFHFPRQLFNFNKKPNDSTLEDSEDKVPVKLTTRDIQVTDSKLDKNYILATCCHPIPGDSICAFADMNGNITVHKLNCPVADSLKSTEGNRLLSANWSTHNEHTFETTLRISGIDTHGLLQEIVNRITNDFNFQMTELIAQANNGMFYCNITLQVYSTDDINKLKNNLLGIKKIFDIKRLE